MKTLHRFIFLIPLLLGFNLTAQAADTLVLKSELLPQVDTVLIFTPQNQTQDSTWPVVYLLHGYGGSYQTFSKLLPMQELANSYGFILVCPDGLKESWYIDSPVRKKWQYESFFTQELYPKIRKDYPVDTARIYITGFSMGGHGAMYLFLRHPKLFKAAASSSGVLDLNASSLKHTSLPKILGDSELHPKNLDRFSSIQHLDSIRFTEKAIFVDCGTKDHLLECNEDFNEAAMDRFIQITFMKMNGRHNAAYWKNSFPWHLEFFSRN